jgi:enoyl-CoA hydratase/carnithine racemase
LPGEGLAVLNSPASAGLSPEAGLRLLLSRDLDGPNTPQLATITLARADSLNAQTPHTWDGLVWIARSLPGTVRAVVIRGEGRSFSAGLDRAMFCAAGVPGAPGVLSLAGGTLEAAEQAIGSWQRAFDWSSDASVVSIAAVQGHAIGAGFQLALGCDLRVLADDAKLTMAEPTLGLVPDLGGTKRLVDLVGYSVAADICLTGRRVDAAEALRLGLASRVVARAELDAEVGTLLDSLLAVDRDAAAETKALLAAATGRSQREQEQAERQAQYRRLRSMNGLDSES